MNGAGPTDELVAWLSAGYADAYRTAFLLLRNGPDAEEAVQEAFLRAWRFRASLGAGSSTGPWLYRVVVNTCYSRLRQEIPRRERESALPAPGEEPTWAAPEEAWRGSELSCDVARALLDLPVHLRVVVVLRYFVDLGEREIATAIGRRPGTVKSRLHEARRVLAAHPALQAMAVEAGPGEEVLS